MANVLRRGARGAVVEDLQQRLLDVGHDPGPIDGIFGRRTKTAVQAFQGANGLSVDGKVGENTARALQWDGLITAIGQGLGAVAEWAADWWGDDDGAGDDDEIAPDRGGAAQDDHGTAGSTTLHSVRIWFKSFIRDEAVESPSPLDSDAWFHGDGRTFSPDPSASARTHSEALITDLYGEHPQLEQYHWCGETIEYELRGGAFVEVDRATAGVEGMQFYDLAYSGGAVIDPVAGVNDVGDTPYVTLEYRCSVTMPLRLSPAIDIWASVQYDRRDGMLTVTGAVDDFPSYEGYAQKNGDGPVIPLFGLEQGDSPTELVGSAHRPFEISVSLGSSG